MTTEELNIQMLFAITGIIIITIGTVLFALLFPDNIFGITIMLVAVLIDALWIIVSLNNKLGKLEYLGIIPIIIAYLSFDFYSNFWQDIPAKVLLFFIFGIGVGFIFVLFERAD
jgi:hypothetical protein